MTVNDNHFFEAYKRLNKLCQDLLSSGDGVTGYIDEMERNPSGSTLVPGWTDWYKQLKHLRWVRNQIAHESLDYDVSTESDIASVTGFYNHIMNCSDPLSELRRRTTPKKTEKVQQESHFTAAPIYEPANKVSQIIEQPKEEKHTGFTVFSVLVFVITIITVVSILYQRDLLPEFINVVVVEVLQWISNR